MKKLLILLCLPFGLLGQSMNYLRGDAGPTDENMLSDRGIQIATNDAFNNMYNFKYFEAEKDFKWLKVKYPQHPLGDFLLGLTEWWKIVPDTKQTKYDEICHAYMDEAIDKAEKLLKKNKKNKEASFIICSAYAVKGRLYAEREKWVKAAFVGRKAIKYLDESRGEENINPELLFGDGVYNYYSKWIHENYKSLRPLLTFFRKGDKEQGIKQLEYVANNAFYARMEARYFLIQIYASERQTVKSYNLSARMHNLYPNNAFFHRYVARNSFALGRLNDAEVYAKQLLENVNEGKYGYGANDGRYGAYIMGYIYLNKYKDLSQAKSFYQKSVDYALENDSKETGFYASSNLALGRIAVTQNQIKDAKGYFEEAVKNSNKGDNVNKEAREELKNLSKKKKK